MTKKERFLKYLYSKGKSITLTYYTGGSVCPCMISRDANNPAYSAQWHIDNSSAEDCNGTGYIEQTEVSTTLKGNIQTELQSLSNFMNRENKSEIGELQKGDIVLFGQCSASDGSWFDVSNLVEDRDYFTIDSNRYFRRNTTDINFESIVGQVSILKRSQ